MSLVDGDREEDDEAEAVCHAGDRRNVNQCVSQGNFPNSPLSQLPCFSSTIAAYKVNLEVMRPFQSEDDECC